MFPSTCSTRTGTRLAKGDSWKDDFPEKNDPKIREAFRPLVQKVRDCVVQIKCNNRNVVLGTVVGPDGWILTKASEIKPEPVCCFSDGKEMTAHIVGIDPRFDLAMLKVDAEKLPLLPWQTKTPDLGQIVAATGLSEDPLALGVISGPKLAIPRIAGILGIMLKDGDGGVLIDKVVPGSPAEKAGIKDKDLVTHLDGKAISDRESLSNNLKMHRPGEKVKLTVKRDDKSIVIEATLGRLLTDAAKKHDLLNRSGIGVSQRADDFPLVVQHDTVIRPTECGTPLVDLDGRVVGLNIARAGRTESYCVPTSTLVVLMYDLMSGRLKPKVVEPPKVEAKPEEKKPEVKPEEKKPEAKPEPKQEAPKAEPKQPEAKPEEKKSEAQPEPKQEAPKAEPKQPEVKPEEKKPEAKPEPKQEAPKAEPKQPEVKPEEKKPEAKPEPKQEAPKAEPKQPEVKPEEKKPEAKPEPKQEAPKAEPKQPEVKPEEKKPEAKPEPKQEAPKAEPKQPEVKPEEKKPEAKPEPKQEAPKAEPKQPEAKPEEKKPEAQPEPKQEAPKAEPKQPEVKPEEKKPEAKPEPKKEAPKAEPKEEKKQAA